MEHQTEYCEPADTIDDLRAEIAHVLDNGRLKPGSSFDRLRMLATHASGRPGQRSKRALDLGLYSDWHDAVNALERALNAGKTDPTVTVIDGASDHPFPRQYSSEDAFQAAQARRHAAHIRGEA